MSNWFKKMMDLILEDEDDHKETNNDRGKKKPDQARSEGKTIGRMQDKTRSIEPKMMHQYPKDGNFRFPLIPDEQRYRQKADRSSERTEHSEEADHSTEEERVTKPRNTSSTRTYTEDRSDRPKFTGVNFTPSDIPSPVYGFRERPTTFPPQYGEQVNEEEEQFGTYEPGYETLKAIDEEYEDLQEEGMIEDVEIEYPPQTDDDEESEMEEGFGLRFESESTDDVEADTVEDPRLTTIFELEKEEDIQDQQQEVDEIEDEVETTDTDTDTDTYEETDSARLDEGDVETAFEHEEHQQGQEQQPQVEEDRTKHERKSSEESTRVSNREKRNPISSDKKKNMIPFNVMMLQRDRNKKKSNNDPQPEKKSNHIQVVERNYRFPSKNLLDAEQFETNDDDSWLDDQIELLQSTLDNFNVKATVLGATKGPSVTRIEVQPAPGVKVNKITNLSDDIKLSLAAKDIRMEAPIPGKNAIGIEVPNKVSKAVTLREIITHPSFHESKSPLSVALGLDISGQPVITDLQKMPHGLIAGATGSGKSVCINSLLISILYKAHPDDVRLMLIDPKMVELAPYNQLPHLVTPVITDAKEATQGLKWAVDEMERRYELFAKSGVRDMERFNKLVKEKGEPDQKLPYIVVVIDELADLMMVSPQEVEDSICRIAQKARACGIHLLLATQRPSVDVITGLIKANIPTRVAFAVSSSVDSRTIIDTNGADKLLGKGDMLFLGNGVSKPVRIQGNFVSDDEIERITEHVKSQKDPDYFFEKEQLIQSTLEFDQSDELFDEACEFVLEQGAASSSSLQRRFRIGYNRAARLIDMMEAKGIVSEAMGSKPRNVLISKQEYYEQSGQEMRQ